MLSKLRSTFQFITPLRFVLLLSAAGLFALVFFSQCRASTTIAFSSPNSDYSSHSCQNESISPPPGVEEIAWTATLPNTYKRLLLTAIVFTTLLFKWTQLRKKLPVFIIYRNRFLFWLWSKSRPFISHKSFLPYFTATRDA